MTSTKYLFTSDIKNDIKLNFIHQWNKNGYAIPNWDSYNAPAFALNDELIDKAAEYCARLTYYCKNNLDKSLSIPFIGPSDENDEIVLEWNGKDWNITLTISKFPIIEIFANKLHDSQFISENPMDMIDPILISKMLNWFSW